MAGNDATKGSEFNQIRAKRRASGVGRMRSKYQAAPGDYGSGRALLRVGAGTTDLLIGKEDIKDWDDEELRRGRKRDKNGQWAGRDPLVVAKVVHDELVRRTLDRANQLLTENLEEAVQVLDNIMKDNTVDAKDRLTAIKMITDRAMGKEPMKIDIGGEAKWQAAITHAIVSMPEHLVDQNMDNRDAEGTID